MAEKDSLLVPLADPECLADVATTSPQPTKFPLWPITTSPPTCEEDAVQQVNNLVARQDSFLNTIIVLALLHSSCAILPAITILKSQIEAFIVYFYTSALLQMFAISLAVLAKQRLSKYSRHLGDPWIERCAGHQRKLDALKNWRFELFLKSPRITFHVALSIFSYGDYQCLLQFYPSYSHILVPLAWPLIVFYLGAIVFTILS